MRSISISFLIILLIGCSSRKTVDDKTQSDSTIRLHDIWSVVSIPGHEDLLAKEKAPNLEIYVERKQILGFGGCNSYSSQIETLTDTEIVFGPIRSTKMACKGLKLEQHFLSALKDTRTYQLEKLNLSFFDSKGEEQVVFLKVD